MPISQRENAIRTIEMTDPEWIPSFINIQGERTWRKYGEKLRDLISRYSVRGGTSYNEVDIPQLRRLIKEHTEPSAHKDKAPLVDEWGCEWHYSLDGVGGIVKKHPLERWDVFDSYQAPPNNTTFNKTPLERRIHSYLTYPQFNGNWRGVRRHVEKEKREGKLTWGNVGHGFLFQRLYYLRGFNNFMRDIFTEPPELERLIDMIVEHYMGIVNKWLDTGVDIINFGDDLGTQRALMIKPEKFRRLIFPAYAKIFGAVRKAGTHVYLHTDGHVLEIADDLVKAGVTILNIRVFQNEGIEAVRKAFKGKVCLDVGTDKQYVVPWGTPENVRDYVKDLVLKLGSENGGLVLVFNFGGPDMAEIPLANIEALFSAVEEYKYYYWKGSEKGH